MAFFVVRGRSPVSWMFALAHSSCLCICHLRPPTSNDLKSVSHILSRKIENLTLSTSARRGLVTFVETGFVPLSAALELPNSEC